MRWDRGNVSPDVIDRRGQGGGGGGAGLFGILFWLLRSRFGWAGVIVGIVLFFVFGGVRMLLGGSEGENAVAPATGQAGEQVQFVSFVLDDAQKVWTDTLASEGKQYRRAKLVLYTDETSSSCGYGSAASGPFYCGRDERVYLDLGFFNELDRRFQAPGDFAQAYVIAHEIGHHVQKVLGVNMGRGHAEGAEGESVRVELQADCYAGIWASSAEKRKLLEIGDVEEALGAASAIGDDRLQRQSRGRVQPESWTHGSSEQRVRWFKRGQEQGRIQACDTFSAQSL
jgi:predicted metalloprotease